MRFFLKKSISKFKNNNGEEKESFEIIKGTNKFIHQIKATTADRNTFNIQEHIIKKNNGLIRNKQKTYKIKASHINNILKESKNSILNTKKDIIDVPQDTTTKKITAKVEKDMKVLPDNKEKTSKKITAKVEKDMKVLPDNKDTLNKKEKKSKKISSKLENKNKAIVTKKEKTPKKIISKVENKKVVAKSKNNVVTKKEKLPNKITSTVKNKKEKKILSKNIEK